VPLFALPARPPLVALRRTQPDGPTVTDLAAERAHARAVLDAYLDTVVEELVLVFVRADEGVSHGIAGLLRNLAATVRGLVSAGLGHAIGRAEPRQLLGLRAFLRERVRVTPDGPWPGLLVFPLDDDTAEALDRAVADVRAGQIDAARPLLAQAMEGVIDGAIRHHLEEPVALLELGFVVRRAIGLATGGIRTGAHAALGRGIMHEGPGQVRGLARFLESATRRA
jgi:DNA-binding FrmR family transcriptional regulator